MSPPPRSTPRRERLNAQQRRAAIVDAAVRLFAERGFRGVTTRELAAAVGVTEPVLYRHFANKRALYDAIIQSTLRTRDHNPDPLLNSYRDEANDRGFFTRLAELILDWHVKDPRYLRLLLYGALEGHELADLFYERQVVAFHGMLTDYIRRRIKDKAFRRVNPHLAAQAFTGMIAHQGMVHAVLSRMRAPAGRKEIIRAIVEIFLNGMINSRAVKK